MLDAADWLSIGAVMVLGIALGNGVAARLVPEIAARITVGLSVLGAVTTLIAAPARMSIRTCAT